MLAGHVVAEAHDTTFEEHVQSELFEPLEMDHSTFAQPVPDDQPGELAAPHMPTADGVERDDRVYINWRPAGSMSATATDMATFTSAHLGDGAAGDARILEPETAATMHDVHHERHPALTDWRYGFYEYGPPEDDLIAHSGGTLHETTKLVLAPEEEVGVFVSYNVRNEGAPANVADEILAAYDLTSTPTAPEEPIESTDDGDGTSLERAETVDGEYELSMVPEQALGVVTRLSIDATDDGRLESHTLGFDEQEWVETEPYVYQEVDGDDTLVAEVDDGTVEAVHLNSAPMATFDPVATHERTTVVGGTIGAALVGFALSILGWIGLAMWRGWRRYRTRARGDGNESASAKADGSAGDEGTALPRERSDADSSRGSAVDRGSLEPPAPRCVSSRSPSSYCSWRRSGLRANSRSSRCRSRYASRSHSRRSSRRSRSRRRSEPPSRGTTATGAGGGASTRRCSPSSDSRSRGSCSSSAFWACKLSRYRTRNVPN
ncbi:class A beta-lactamase-related serine hydrolase [Natrialba swarupiae]|nr:class A beta-lactamase-related serine hydrolase [Natrialba swarupiae]